jgi:hypothetical protein
MHLPLTTQPVGEVRGDGGQDVKRLRVTTVAQLDGFIYIP